VNKFNVAEVLKNNKSIDEKLINAGNRLEKDLRNLGVDTKPSYSLTQPLSSTWLSSNR